LLGTTLGLVWTPCAGPVLGSIPDYRCDLKNGMASVLLVVYAMGCRDFRCWRIAYGGQAVTTRVRRVARYPRAASKVGIVVIAFSVLSYFQYDTLIVRG